ncbi:MAG: hypothetical protein J2P44_00710, partial [Candidatus Dormibacteraeota bacterium]|nr:hypothetical protein [Candidatus Dormibacteraeota bacterium]
ALLPEMLERLESTFPGVSVDVPDRTWHYPNYVPATRELLSFVSGLPEMRGRDALTELARVGPQRKFDLLVEQAMEGFGLTFNVPARARKEVRDRIRAALEAHVERNLGWMSPSDPTRPGKLDTLEPHALSTIMGRQISMELMRQLYAEGERFGMELTEGWRRTLTTTELQMAGELLDAPRFDGPEAHQAVESWIRAAESRHRQVHSPVLSRPERPRWRFAVHQHRAGRGRHFHMGHGMSR